MGLVRHLGMGYWRMRCDTCGYAIKPADTDLAGLLAIAWQHRRHT